MIAEHYPRDGIAAAPMGATAKQAAAKPKKEPSSLSPEEMSKRQRIAALLAFCLTIPAWMIFRLLTSTLGGLDAVIALGLGAAAAAVAFVVAAKV